MEFFKESVSDNLSFQWSQEHQEFQVYRFGRCESRKVSQTYLSNSLTLQWSKLMPRDKASDRPRPPAFQVWASAMTPSCLPVWKETLSINKHAWFHQCQSSQVTEQHVSPPPRVCACRGDLLSSVTEIDRMISGFGNILGIHFFSLYLLCFLLFSFKKVNRSFQAKILSGSNHVSWENMKVLGACFASKNPKVHLDWSFWTICSAVSQSLGLQTAVCQLMWLWAICSTPGLKVEPTQTLWIESGVLPGRGNGAPWQKNEKRPLRHHSASMCENNYVIMF